MVGISGQGLGICQTWRPITEPIAQPYEANLDNQSVLTQMHSNAKKTRLMLLTHLYLEVSFALIPCLRVSLLLYHRGVQYQ